MTTTERLRATLQSRFKSEPSDADFLQYVEFDEEWQSPCQIGEPDENEMILWRPVERVQGIDWSPYEEALGEPVQQAYKDLFGSFWCGEFEIATEQGNVILSLFWNEEEERRFLASVVGMAAKQKQAGQPVKLTVAVFCDDRFISMCNGTGELFLEDPGREAQPMFASIDKFLDNI